MDSQVEPKDPTFWQLIKEEAARKLVDWAFKGAIIFVAVAMLAGGAYWYGGRIAHYLFVRPAVAVKDAAKAKAHDATTAVREKSEQIRERVEDTKDTWKEGASEKLQGVRELGREKWERTKDLVPGAASDAEDWAADKAKAAADKAKQRLEKWRHRTDDTDAAE